MTIIKSYLIESISNRLDMPREKSAQLVKSVLDNNMKTLESGGYVK